MLKQTRSLISRSKSALKRRLRLWDPTMLSKKKKDDLLRIILDGVQWPGSRAVRISLDDSANDNDEYPRDINVDVIWERGPDTTYRGVLRADRIEEDVLYDYDSLGKSLSKKGD